MSDSLPEEAPVTPEAPQGPSSEPAVETDSVDSNGVVPKERFNGLQRTYQTEKSAWEAQRSAMEAEIERLSTSQQESDVAQVDPEILDEVRQLRSELANERLGRVRAEILQEFPEVGPFADLIVGKNADEIRAVAADLAGRIGQLNPATGPEGEAPSGETSASTGEGGEEAPASAPTFGGAANASDEASVDDRVHSALEQRDWGSYLRAAAERAELQGGTELVS